MYRRGLGDMGDRATSRGNSDSDSDSEDSEISTESEEEYGGDKEPSYNAKSAKGIIGSLATGAESSSYADQKLHSTESRLPVASHTESLSAAQSRSALIRRLASNVNGKEWLKWFDKDMRQQLLCIESKLLPLWNSGLCYPSVDQVMLPLCMIPRAKTKVLLLCKQPYKSGSMACGIPVLCGNSMSTPSSGYFREFIERYWDGVSAENFMSLYYASGVLVMNASCTVERQYDDRYSLSHSHFSLWTRFMMPLVHKLHSEGVLIVALGVEAKGLISNIEDKSRCLFATFPYNKESGAAFTQTMNTVFSEHLFIVEEENDDS